MTPKAFENANLIRKKHMHLPIKIRRSTALGSKILILSIIDSLQERVYNIVVKIYHIQLQGKQVKF